MIGLTHRQASLLGFIESYLAENDGVAPSFTEMMAGIGIVTRSNLHYMLMRLEERGAIRRIRGRHRAIEVLRPAHRFCCPECDGAVHPTYRYCPQCGHPVAALQPSAYSFKGHRTMAEVMAREADDPTLEAA